MEATECAILGPAGSYSEMAFRRFKRSGGCVKYCRTIREIFESVVGGAVEAGLVPLENLIQGLVNETLDSLALYRGDVQIVDAIVLPLSHALGVLPGVQLADLRRVVSHYQALDQCAGFLSRELTNVEMQAVASTSAGIQIVKAGDDRSVAAIAGEESLRECGLEVMFSNISDSPDNRTRFALIKLRHEIAAGICSEQRHRREGQVLASSAMQQCEKAVESSADHSTERFAEVSVQGESGAERETQALVGHHTVSGSTYITSIMIIPGRDRQGLLHEVLTVISVECGVNISSIHSRPDLRGGFVFYLELEGAECDLRVKVCLDRLRDYCKTATGDVAEVVVFGSYRRQSFFEQPFSRVGIVGGRGEMGSFLERFFTEAGFQVFIHDVDTEQSLQDFVAEVEVVVLSVPMGVASKVAQEVAEVARSGQLIVENCSIKNCALPVLTQSVASGVEVLGMHTMFAGRSVGMKAGAAVEAGGNAKGACKQVSMPSGSAIGSAITVGLKGENVIFTLTEHSSFLAESFVDVFYKYGIHIHNAAEQDHDRYTAITQSLTHLLLLSYGRVVSDVVQDFSDIEPFLTPISRELMDIVRRVAKQNDGLLSDIQMLNNESHRVRELFRGIFDDIKADLDESSNAKLLEAVSAIRRIF